jgi:hypothetical protein
MIKQGARARVVKCVRSIAQEDRVDKNFILKNDPLYGKSNLRQKIDARFKRQRDTTSEVKDAALKVLHAQNGDANRDTFNLIKHFRNK